MPTIFRDAQIQELARRRLDLIAQAREVVEFYEATLKNITRPDRILTFFDNLMPFVTSLLAKGGRCPVFSQVERLKKHAADLGIDQQDIWGAVNALLEQACDYEDGMFSLFDQAACIVVGLPGGMPYSRSVEIYLRNMIAVVRDAKPSTPVSQDILPYCVLFALQFAYYADWLDKLLLGTLKAHRGQVVTILFEKEVLWELLQKFLRLYESGGPLLGIFTAFIESRCRLPEPSAVRGQPVALTHPRLREGLEGTFNFIFDSRRSRNTFESRNALPLRNKPTAWSFQACFDCL